MILTLKLCQAQRNSAAIDDTLDGFLAVVLTKLTNYEL